MFSARKRPDRPRRGVTLVEMLVVVALVVLMMVILVQIFQSALGAMSASRTNQELDVILRSIDSMIRSDLAGATAKMTPPNDPALKQGYFEYIENAPADLQGEDTDDIIAFTSKAPEGQVFTGRQWLAPAANKSIQPITITSQTAEIVYFLRNGNLYRRVFLVAPDRASSVTTTYNAMTQNGTMNLGCNFPTSIFGGQLQVSWLGMNDLSARPGGTIVVNNKPVILPPILNDLGDLTNRENRAFRPRFVNDFTGPNGLVPDGLPDDNNGDGVPDHYPTLYYNGNGGHPYTVTDASGNVTAIWSPNGLTTELVGYPGSIRLGQNAVSPLSIFAFPYVFPGMYSVPEGSTKNGITVTPPANLRGWRHGMFPLTTSNSIIYNHSPLGYKILDNLQDPTDTQSWWGFPTWRETMTAYTSTTNGQSGWGDPIVGVNATSNYTQPLGLIPLPPQTPYSINAPSFLTPLNQGTTPPPLFCDNAGSSSFVSIPPAYPGAANPLWEDDLILTNVRSFDVKAYDPDAPLYNQASNAPFSSGYQDLGYAYPSFIDGITTSTPPLWQPNTIPLTVGLGGIPIGFGHEGRMPPAFNDYRLHPRRPTYVYPLNNTPTTFPYNIGDPNPYPPFSTASSKSNPTRMVRTFDTWSTAYTNAPDSDILLHGYSNSGLSIYPSYPPPYPSPLRGIQIQVRVTDPRNERTKVLTIRVDFTDKL